jgi:hypothetical protein
MSGADVPPPRRRRGHRTLGQKLRESREREVCRLYLSKLASVRQLAARFDLTSETVRGILRRHRLVVART